MKEITNKEYSERDFYVKEHENYPLVDKNYEELTKLGNNKTILSMGGAGREAKLLVSKSMKVTSVDFSKAMIQRSKELEPNAEYVQSDILEFIKNNVRKRKFDYIVGMYNFLCGIPKKDRELFIENLVKMLNERGRIILRIKWIKYNPKEITRLIISFFYFTIIKRKSWQLGDVVLKSSKTEFCVSHYFTRNQIKSLLNGLNYEISGETIKILK
jgi:SAM-dependent methyltransferase